MGVVRQDEPQVARVKDLLVPVDLMNDFPGFDQEKLIEIVVVPLVARMRRAVVLLRKEKMIFPIPMDQPVSDRFC